MWIEKGLKISFLEISQICHFHHIFNFNVLVHKAELADSGILLPPGYTYCWLSAEDEVLWSHKVGVNPLLGVNITYRTTVELHCHTSDSCLVYVDILYQYQYKFYFPYLNKYIAVPGPQVSPAIMVCGSFKLTPTLISHLLGSHGSNWSSSTQMSQILHFQAILQIDLTWPLTFICDLWPHEHVKFPTIYQYSKFGSNWTSTFQLHFCS